jgi:hypothetical protein
VGRTLLSDAFEVDVGFVRKLLLGQKVKVKGVGQECPTHPG